MPQGDVEFMRVEFLSLEGRYGEAEMQKTRSQFEEELQRLRDRLLKMADNVDGMLDDALTAMTQQDETLAKRVVQFDDLIDRLDVEIETQCLRLIALQQPVARDLRLIGTSMKIIADLERTGDLAVDIAKMGRRLSKRGVRYRPLVDLPLLGEMARKMLVDAMGAFSRHDLELAQAVISGDAAVNNLYHYQRDHLTVLMEREPDTVALAVPQLFTAKYLERVGDHAVNIARRVYYVETGDILDVSRE